MAGTPAVHQGQLTPNQRLGPEDRKENYAGCSEAGSKLILIKVQRWPFTISRLIFENGILF